MKKELIIILGVFALSSCWNKYDSEIYFPEEIPIEISLLKETYLSVPLNMEHCDSLLFISDFRGDSLLWIYNIKRNEFTSRFAPFGEGPDDFLSPIEIKVLDSVLIIHNRWHYSLKEYHLNSNGSLLTKKSVISKLPTDIDRIHPLNNHTYIASGRFNEGRYAILDKNGKPIKYCGEYPSYFSEETKIPNFPKFMFHQTMFDSNSKSDKLVGVTSHVLDIMELAGDSLELTNRLLLSPYEYKYRQNDYSAQAIENIRNEIGVKRVYATDDFIYLLYVPFPEKQYHELQVKSCEIWMFDWKGKPIKKLVSNSEICTFCVNRENDTIYCITNAPEPTIGRIVIN